MTGAEAEGLAADYLQRNGVTILERNWRCKGGELDIIADEDGVRVIVEVKMRGSLSHGLPFEMVTRDKQQKIIRAAAQYQQQQGHWGDVRFDVVAITFDTRGVPQVEHLPHAFQVESK